jgi:hypothetical protein
LLCELLHGGCTRWRFVGSLASRKRGIVSARSGKDGDRNEGKQ